VRALRAISCHRYSYQIGVTKVCDKSVTQVVRNMDSRYDKGVTQVARNTGRVRTSNRASEVDGNAPVAGRDRRQRRRHGGHRLRTLHSIQNSRMPQYSNGHTYRIFVFFICTSYRIVLWCSIQMVTPREYSCCSVALHTEYSCGSVLKRSNLQNIRVVQLHSIHNSLVVQYSNGHTWRTFVLFSCTSYRTVLWCSIQLVTYGEYSCCSVALHI
jgi:hypothetical protein